MGEIPTSQVHVQLQMVSHPSVQGPLWGQKVEHTRTMSGRWSAGAPVKEESQARSGYTDCGQWDKPCF